MNPLLQSGLFQLHQYSPFTDHLAFLAKQRLDRLANLKALSTEQSEVLGAVVQALVKF
ncbi:hypothetical protein D3C77_688970 [compost metagenome]